MEIRIDVIGAMRNTVKTFADRLCFVDELIQNAQRAGAKRVDFQLGDDSILYSDNGPGCSDLNKVFTQSLSGWSSQVQDAEDPFGFGFFSCIVVSDDIIVRSGRVGARFDVARMFEEERTDVITTTELGREVKGFEVDLNSLKDLNMRMVRERIADVARYVGVKVYLDGESCQAHSMVKKTIEEQANKFSIVIKHKMFSGVVYPSVWSGLQTYYQGRAVSEVWIHGLSGRLEVKTGVANPRCPDRKAWIDNSAFWAMKAKLNEYARKVMLDVVKTGTDDDIDRYESAIDSLLGAKVYAKYLNFDLREGDAIASLLPSDDTAEGSVQDEAPSFDEVYESVACGDDDRQDMAIVPPVDVPQQEQGLAVALVPTTESVTPVEIVNTFSALRKEKVIFWLAADEVENNVDKLREAAYYGAKVVVCKNKLHQKAIQLLKGAQHISTLSKGLKHSMDLLDRGPNTPEERRAEKLLNAMTAVVGNFPVEVAEVVFYNNYFLNGQSTGKREKAGKAIAATDGKAIFVQRAAMPSDMLKGIALDAPIGARDRAFMMQMLQTIAHELSHAVLGLPDGDVAFYEGLLQMQEQIIASVFNVAHLDESQETSAVVVEKVIVEERVIVNVPRYEGGQLGMFAARCSDNS